MKENFQRALALLLKSEGGLDDDPADHGGRTAYGITAREYAAWRREHGLPVRDVWQITKEEYTQIYHEEYWQPWCDSFPSGLDYLYFDMAVNAGPHRATVLLQRALGVTDDGRIGPITREALRKADPNRLIDDYSEAKRNFYRALHQPRFIRGWLNRTASVERDASRMIGELA